MSKLSVSCNFFLSAHSTGEQTRAARRKLAVVRLMVDDSVGGVRRGSRVVYTIERVFDARI